MFSESHHRHIESLRDGFCSSAELTAGEVGSLLVGKTVLLLTLEDLVSEERYCRRFRGELLRSEQLPPTVRECLRDQSTPTVTRCCNAVIPTRASTPAERISSLAASKAR